MSGFEITRVGEGDLPDLLPLLRAYCDFYAVAPSHEALLALSRELGLVDALIERCAEAARAHGARSLGWQTAKDNRRAQAVYERAGAKRSEWLDYELRVG